MNRKVLIQHWQLSQAEITWRVWNIDEPVWCEWLQRAAPQRCHCTVCPFTSAYTCNVVIFKLQSRSSYIIMRRRKKRSMRKRKRRSSRSTRMRGRRRRSSSRRRRSCFGSSWRRRRKRRRRRNNIKRRRKKKKNRSIYLVLHLLNVSSAQGRFVTWLTTPWGGSCRFSPER